jgi:hypothetical protein
MKYFFNYSFNELPWKIFGILFVLMWVVLIINTLLQSMFPKIEDRLEKIFQLTMKHIGLTLKYGLISWGLLFIVRFIFRLF